MLRVESLTVIIEGSRILNEVDLVVPDGEVLAVLGPSGSGKTTLLRALAGLQAIDAGAIAWDGERVDELPPHLRGFGLMFQDYALFPHQTVAQNVGFGLRMQHRPAAEIDARVTEVLDWVGLSRHGDRSVSRLSGGEQQRVALARAVAPEPVLLMLDEPLGSLDRALRERLMEELRELLAEISITSIYVTHDQQEAFALADRVVVLREGRVVQQGTAQDLWAHPADEWVARFLGFRNIVDAEVVDHVAQTVWGSFDVGPLSDGSHRVVIRPDAFAVVSEGGLRATVLTESFRGGHWTVEVSVDGGPALTVELTKPTESDVINLEIDPSRLSVLGSESA